MIKGTIDKGSVQVSVRGSVPVLAAEVCCLTRAIWKSILEDDDKRAEAFKKCIINGINDSDTFDDDECDNLGNDDMLDQLKKLLKGLEKLEGMSKDED